MGDILEYLPNGPNFSPFTGAAGIVSALVAVLLGIIVIVSLVLGFVSAARFATANNADNPAKAQAYKSDMFKKFTIVLIVLLFGTILTIINSIFRAVT